MGISVLRLSTLPAAAGRPLTNPDTPTESPLFHNSRRPQSNYRKSYWWLPQLPVPDDYHRGGPIGKAAGTEADEADIQNFADHVLRKESRRSSRYSSFTTEVKIARRFTCASDAIERVGK
jgi:hypothetical protein